MRSYWKHPFFLLTLNAQLRRTAHLGRRRTLRLRHRRLLVDSSMVSRFVAIPNGRGWQRLGIGPLLVGHRLGEFARTRSRVRHYKRKRAKALEKRQKEEAKAAKAKATGGTAAKAKRLGVKKRAAGTAQTNSPATTPKGAYGRRRRLRRLLGQRGMLRQRAKGMQLRLQTSVAEGAAELEQLRQ